MRNKQTTLNAGKAKAGPETTFAGLTPAVLKFLRDVRRHNSKPWFESHRDNYRRLLLEPFQALVADLSGIMLTIDPQFETRPAVTKTISRIHRDTRFSKDKSLYRDAVWLTFKRPGNTWQDAPAFFFEITPRFYRYGMGFYSASRATMNDLRRAIDDDPKAFQRVTAFLSRKGSRYTLYGDKYKRPLPCEHSDRIQDWYQCKSFYLSCDREIDDLLYSGSLVPELASGFLMLGPLYKYLWDSRR
jgi:uncharacterized protein (TIGR02453 family)